MAKAKRRAPDKDSLRELYLKSGNQCAFPACTRVMLNRAGEFIGQICHIEAAEEGGERFNSAMSDDERAAFPNLMLMCYEHHVVTNNVDAFPVPRLQAMKAEHEAKFIDPAQAILDGDERQLSGGVVQIGPNNRAVVAPNNGIISLGDTHHHHEQAQWSPPKIELCGALALARPPWKSQEGKQFMEWGAFIALFLTQPARQQTVFASHQCTAKWVLSTGKTIGPFHHMTFRSARGGTVKATEKMVTVDGPGLFEVRSSVNIEWNDGPDDFYNNPVQITFTLIPAGQEQPIEVTTTLPVCNFPPSKKGRWEVGNHIFSA